MKGLVCVIKDVHDEVSTAGESDEESGVSAEGANEVASDESSGASVGVQRGVDVSVGCAGDACVFGGADAGGGFNGRDRTCSGACQ